jgi:hypothetical protein
MRQWEAPCKAGLLRCPETVTIESGVEDDSHIGAAWVFTRSGGAWAQQGGKLVGTGAVGNYIQQGYSVALSADANTAIMGGPSDDSNTGATWVFVQLTKEDCKNGGWLNFPSPPGPFTSQGQCVSYFAKQQRHSGK